MLLSIFINKICDYFIDCEGKYYDTMKNYLVVDFEFTTYTRPVGRPNGFFSEIIEIGAVKLAGDPLATTGTLQDFVKPKFFPRQAKDSMDFCMITPKDMEKAIDFPKMVAELGALNEQGETYFVAWGKEDYKVLQRGCEHHKIENPILLTDYLDLAEAYRLWKGDDYTTGLKRATEEQNVDTAGLWHTAFDDANNTGKLLIDLLAKGWTPEAYFEAKENSKANKANK